VSFASLTGPQKAALVILGLDERVACDVLRHLEEVELRRLAASVEALDTLPIGELERVFSDFADKMQQPMLPRSGGEYVRRLTAAALGDDRAKRLFAPPAIIREPIETIKTAKTATLAELLGEEHPQVAAVILSQLPREQAAKVLEIMPEETQVDLIGRIAAMEEVPVRAVEVASEALARALAAAGGIADKREREEFDGVAFTAGLLNEMNPNETERILGSLSESDPKTAPKIREAMFTFEDLSRIDVRNLQTLMREVPGEALLIALKTASEALRNHFLSAVSSRAAEQMREDLSLMPPTRLSDVEKAQREIVEIATRLAGENRLVLPGSSSSEKLV
jgi:flagellar motor switch protein FliG